MSEDAWGEIGFERPRPLGRALRIALATAFGVYALLQLAVFAGHGLVGIDVSLYSQAAVAWLSGGDPWSVSVNGISFAAPPTSLLPYIPVAFLPESMAIALTIAALTGLAAVAFHHLRLPFWWLLYPPMAQALIVGNLDAAVFAVLVIGPRWLAPLLKTYALVPVLSMPRALVIATLAFAITLPFLPWSTFAAEINQIMATLESQNDGPTAWGSWPLMLAAGIALVALGRRGLWLAVPVLWPSTQMHYAVMAIPAIVTSPILVLGFALQIPQAPAVSVIGLALVERLQLPHVGSSSSS